MKIEQICTSLTISRRLKELGVKQESYFSWVKYMYKGGSDFRLEQNRMSDESEKYDCSAFTASELGIYLPNTINGKDFFVDRFHDLWLYGYFDIYEDDKNYQKTEADARGELLIWLIENNLIDNSEVKG